MLAVQFAPRVAQRVVHSQRDGRHDVRRVARQRHQVHAVLRCHLVRVRHVKQECSRRVASGQHHLLRVDEQNVRAVRVAEFGQVGHEVRLEPVDEAARVHDGRLGEREADAASAQLGPLLGALREGPLNANHLRGAQHERRQEFAARVATQVDGDGALASSVRTERHEAVRVGRRERVALVERQVHLVEAPDDRHLALLLQRGEQLLVAAEERAHCLVHRRVHVVDVVDPRVRGTRGDREERVVLRDEAPHRLAREERRTRLVLVRMAHAEVVRDAVGDGASGGHELVVGEEHESGGHVELVSQREQRRVGRAQRAAR